MTNTPTDNLTSATTDGHHIYCGSLHPDNAECTCPMGRKATDTSVQKLHKSPADSKLHKTQIAPDVELVDAIAQELANQYGDKWDAQHFGETMHGETPEEMRAGYREVARSILPLLASREAALLESHSRFYGELLRDLRDIAHRGWNAGISKNEEIRDRIDSAFARTLSKGETP
jgi:hypothetical protein